MRILVVEDEFSLVDIIATKLKNEKYYVDISLDGEVIALGSDMLQNPDKSSKQKYVSFTLNSKISKNSNISLKDSKDNEIISFTADENFKTLIISNSGLSTETYYIYI